MQKRRSVYGKQLYESGRCGKRAGYFKVLENEVAGKMYQRSELGYGDRSGRFRHPHPPGHVAENDGFLRERTQQRTPAQSSARPRSDRPHRAAGITEITTLMF